MMLNLLVLVSLLLVEVHPSAIVSSYEDFIQIDGFNMTLHEDILFEQFKVNYERMYKTTSEEEERRHIFAENVRYINKHNLEYANGESTYFLGINQFTDMTYEESMIDGVKCVQVGLSTVNTSIFFPPENYEAPSSVDWRQKGYVTSVKNQGKCASCWAFGAVGAIEGQHFRKTGKLIDLSPQQLVDCSKKDGCSGGNANAAFRYVIDAGGIQAEADYSYKASDGTCSFNKDKIKATIQSYEEVNEGEENLEKAIATEGPIAASICTCKSFYKYKTGVFNDPACRDGDLNHIVLVVGYGKSSGLDYWLLKNSWKATWGEEGYIRIARNKGNMCRIASEAFFPIVDASPNKGSKNRSVSVFLLLIVMAIYSLE